jgi:adenylate cyclase
MHRSRGAIVEVAHSQLRRGLKCAISLPALWAGLSDPMEPNMNNRWQLRVYESERLVFEADMTGTVEIGRQQTDDEKRPGDDTFRPWHYQTGGIWRAVVASLKEITVSRRHLEVKPLANGRFLLTNISGTQVVNLPGLELHSRNSMEVSLPVMARLGTKTIRLQTPEADDLSCLPTATIAPGSSSVLLNMHAAMARTDGPSMKAEQLIDWIQAFLGLLQSAAGTEDFYIKAAKAIVDLVKLDSGRVLILDGEHWTERAVQQGPTLTPDAPWRPSSRVLDNVQRGKKTFWQIPDLRGSFSTRGIDAVVAAPILDGAGEVIGALYGERRLIGGQVQRPISQLEAMLVEVLASGVAAGLARVEHERAALQARLQMEQFFTPSLAAKLEAHPELLEGRATDVSVLFCDIRGFSRVSEKLGPAQTVEWIADVMSDLSQCVLDHEGVVVDYTGDELMAMWGAPDDQPDHAARACRAALAMFKCLPKLNERWQVILQEPLNVGIGINSGIAQVGNVGSRIKFKYGALGNTVNLASRVQGATKYLKAPLLITDSTYAGLAGGFQTRRLCQVRVVNIDQPVTLHELAAADDEAQGTLKLAYEEALAEFTQGAFRPACQILGRLILEHPDDGPALLLLARAVNCLVEEPDAFDPVMVLPGK